MVKIVYIVCTCKLNNNYNNIIIIIANYNSSTVTKLQLGGFYDILLSLVSKVFLVPGTVGTRVGPLPRFVYSTLCVYMLSRIFFYDHTYLTWLRPVHQMNISTTKTAAIGVFCDIFYSNELC